MQPQVRPSDILIANRFQQKRLTQHQLLLLRLLVFQL